MGCSPSMTSCCRGELPRLEHLHIGAAESGKFAQQRIQGAVGVAGQVSKPVVVSKSTLGPPAMIRRAGDPVFSSHYDVTDVIERAEGISPFRPRIQGSAAPSSSTWGSPGTAGTSIACPRSNPFRSKILSSAGASRLPVRFHGGASWGSTQDCHTFSGLTVWRLSPAAFPMRSPGSRQTRLSPVMGIRWSPKRLGEPDRPGLPRAVPSRQGRALLFTYRPPSRDGMLGAPGPVFIHARDCRQFRDTAFPPGLLSLPLLIEAWASGNRIHSARQASGSASKTSSGSSWRIPRTAYLHVRHGSGVPHRERGPRAAHGGISSIASWRYMKRPGSSAWVPAEGS